MAIRFISLKCPECGANLSIEKGRTQAYCTYCGTRILISNDNEYIYRDEAEMRKAEARMKEAELDHSVRMKELELLEHDTKKSSFWPDVFLALGAIILLASVVLLIVQKDDEHTVAAIMLMFLGGLMALFAVMVKQEDKEKREGMVQLRAGKIQFPYLAQELSKADCQALKEQLQVAGFADVKLISLRDLSRSATSKLGKVESITVNGKFAQQGGWYNKNDPVVIIYHGPRGY